jgi:tetratricopeptide (TPR) repeat protein
LLVRYGDVLALLGLEQESVLQYEQAIKARPDCLEATIKLGTVYLQNNDYQAAARHFNRAFEINDSIVDAYIGLAVAYKLSKNDAEAADTLSLAAAIEPNSSLLFTQTAALHLRNTLNDQFDSSLQDNHDLIEKVITAHQDQLNVNPNNPDLYYRLGILMMHASRLDKAICLSESGDNNSALEVLSGPDFLDKDTLDLHYKTALLYCDKVKFACSLINLENFLSDNFADSNACPNISIVLQNLGLLDRVSCMWDSLEDTTKQALKMF